MCPNAREENAALGFYSSLRDEQDRHRSDSRTLHAQANPSGSAIRSAVDVGRAGPVKAG